MRVNIASGEIAENIHYVVSGATSGDYITYNSIDYLDGQSFVGTSTATYTATGTPFVYENTIFVNSGTEIILPIVYNETTQFVNSGFEQSIIQYPEQPIFINSGLEVGKQVLYFLENNPTTESITQQGTYFLNKAEYKISIPTTNEKYNIIVDICGNPPYTWEQLRTNENIFCQYFNNDIFSNNLISFVIDEGTDNEIKVLTFKE